MENLLHGCSRSDRNVDDNCLNGLFQVRELTGEHLNCHKLVLTTLQARGD